MSNDITPDILPELTNDDLMEMGINSLGARKRILKAIKPPPVPATGNEAVAADLPPCQGNNESKWQNCEGILTSHSGKEYVGVFKDGIFDGENAEHGIKWVGGYKNGTLNGQGTLTFFSPSKSV